MISQRKLASVLSALAMATATSAAASDEQPVPLSPVLISAQPDETPLTVVSNPRAALQPIPAQDGAEALKNIPGIALIRKGGTDGDPVLRGAAGSRLGILLDGENILGGCGNRMDPPTAYVFPSSYDRITVLKGPQSVLHGPGNSAGVVLFERNTPTFSTPTAHANGSVVLGSFGRADEFAEVLAGSRVGSLRLAGSHTQADNYKDGDGRLISSHYKRWSTNATLALNTSEHSSVELSGIRSDGEAAYADRGMDGSLFARQNVGLRFRAHDLSPLLREIDVKAFYNYVDHVMDNYSERTFTPSAMMPGQAASNPDRKTTGGRAALTLAPAEASSLVFGVDDQFNRHTSRSTSDERTLAYETLARTPDAEFSQNGVFGELTQKFSGSSRLIGGARADFWKATDFRAKVSTGMMGSAVNPSANQTRKDTLGAGFLRYEKDIAPGATLFAGYGVAERFPDFWELIGKESATSVSAFSTHAERNRQFDLGALYHSGGLHASLSLFASHVDDFILIQSGVSKASGMMGTRSATISRNIGARTRGAEASLSYSFAQGWKSEASLAYVRGDNLTDNLPLAQLPPLEGKLGLSYTRERFSVGSLLRAVAAQNRYALKQGNIVGQDLGSTAGFSVFSLNASWRFISQLEASAGVDNLFDKTYAEHLSKGGAMVAGFPEPTTRVNEPGRNLWLRVSLRF